MLLRTDRRGLITRPIWLNPTLPMPIPDGAGPYRPAGDGGYSEYSGPVDMRSEGWKLHVSAAPEQAADVARKVLPVLTRLGVKHKFMHPARLNNQPPHKAGKFIAVYPESPLRAHQVMQALTPHLRGHTGPPLPNELRFGPSGLVFARYGAYEGEYLTAPHGWKLRDVARDQTGSPRLGGTMRPPWVKPLTEDQSPELFPKVPLRDLKKLKGLTKGMVAWVDD